MRSVTKAISSATGAGPLNRQVRPPAVQETTPSSPSWNPRTTTPLASWTTSGRLDVTRANVKPLSFGGGIHFCLGAQLARIEAEIAIATLLRRLPDLRIDDVENPEWRPTFVLRGLKRLPASW